MKKPSPITCLFLDVGGVLLSNGWDHHARRRAANRFNLQLAEVEERHKLFFATYEEGKLSFEEYLNRVYFYCERNFTRAAFRDFMLEQSKSDDEMLHLIKELKRLHNLKIAVVNNEGRELNAYRIRHFNLDKMADLFISSCFVGVRKPDAEIFRLALDITQTPASEILYIDDTAMFVEIAKGMGISGIVHTDYSTTRKALALKGLAMDTGVIREAG